MNINLRRAAIHLIITSSLLMSFGMAYAEEAPLPAANAATVQTESYSLMDRLNVQVKGVFNEKSSDGVRLGAVVRVANTSGDIVRIPDHELRVKTSGGVVYKLAPSSSNARGVQPQSYDDLVYYKVIDKQTDIKLTELSLVDVNFDVYPKTETVLAAVPIQSVTWNGRHSKVSSSGAVKSWGEPFTIPTLDSPLTYTPVQYTKNNTNQGISYVVKLLVCNPSSQTETVPVFRLDGKSKERIYSGSRLNTKPVSLEPGEKKYIYYSIATDMDVELDGLNVLITETFASSSSAGSGAGGNGTVTFDIGQIYISLRSEMAGNASAAYSFGSPIAVDSLSNFVNPQLDISLVELHKSTNDENGNQTVFAKFMLTNNGEKFITVPAFQTELWTESGHSYSGNRQQTSLAQIESGTSIIVSYGFTLPPSEDARQFKLKLMDDQSSAPYKSEIASCDVSLQQEDEKSTLKLYPYTLNIKTLLAVPVINPTPTNSMAYSYKLKLDIDLQRDKKVMVDSSFSKLKIELLDVDGKLLGTKYFPFTGVQRITSGDKDLAFDGLDMDSATDRVTIKFYESVATPSGEVNRLLYTLEQK